MINWISRRRQLKQYWSWFFKYDIIIEEVLLLSFLNVEYLLPNLGRHFLSILHKYGLSDVIWWAHFSLYLTILEIINIYARIVLFQIDLPGESTQSC